jgi:hypothetical protein
VIFIPIEDTDIPLAQYQRYLIKRYNYRYFCRSCIHNFEAETKTSECKICGEKDVVLLPPDGYGQKHSSGLNHIKGIVSKIRRFLAPNN